MTKYTIYHHHHQSDIPTRPLLASVVNLRSPVRRLRTGRWATMYYSSVLIIFRIRTEGQNTDGSKFSLENLIKILVHIVKLFSKFDEYWKEKFFNYVNMGNCREFFSNILTGQFRQSEPVTLSALWSYHSPSQLDIFLELQKLNKWREGTIYFVREVRG